MAYISKVRLPDASEYDIRDAALTEDVGELVAPYSQVEWVESNGKQFVYLDWKPPIATWGFEADFICRNAVGTAMGTWSESTNANGYGAIFGTHNAAGTNDCELNSYSNGLLRIGPLANVATGYVTDRTSRQTIKLIGTTLTKANGTTATVTRASETANKPYSNMCVFACHVGVRRAGTGNLTYPSSTRIYSLKFYDGTTLKVDLVGAVRRSDNVTGLYDRVSEHFYSAPGCSFGDEVGDLGEPEPIAGAVAHVVPMVTTNNHAASRMWTADMPSLKSLEDGQRICLMAKYPSAPSVETTELAGWDDTGTAYNVYLKLTLADGSTTGWVPLYYRNTNRMTTHAGAGNTVMLTYKENVIINASDTAATPIMRGWFWDFVYDNNTTPQYLFHTNHVLAKAAITAESLIVGDADGYQKVASGVTFDVSYPMLWCNGAVAAGAANYANMFLCYYDRNLSGIKSGYTSAKNKVQYLIVTISGKTATIDSQIVTDTLPTTDDGKVYIVIGKLGNNSTGANYFVLYPDHEMLWYKNGAVRPYGTYGDASTSAKGVVQLSSSVTSTSETTAATSAAVKTARDLANTANETANSALSGVNGTLIYDHTYTIANGVATFTAHVWRKGTEVTSEFPDSAFGWSYRPDASISGTPTATSLGTGKTKQVTLSQLGLGGHVIGTFTTS